ncbi:MAG: hypothetical protein JWM67_3288 [Mycobacterium sp.]|nr:hypothetical protein [Mycobacterium sp.]
MPDTFSTPVMLRGVVPVPDSSSVFSASMIAAARSFSTNCWNAGKSLSVSIVTSTQPAIFATVAVNAGALTTLPGFAAPSATTPAVARAACTKYSTTGPLLATAGIRAAIRFGSRREMTAGSIRCGNVLCGRLDDVTGVFTPSCARKPLERTRLSCSSSRTSSSSVSDGIAPSWQSPPPVAECFTADADWPLPVTDGVAGCSGPPAPNAFPPRPRRTRAWTT